jgi:hypothetical protein
VLELQWLGYNTRHQYSGATLQCTLSIISETPFITGNYTGVADSRFLSWLQIFQSLLWIWRAVATRDSNSRLAPLPKCNRRIKVPAVHRGSWKPHSESPAGPREIERTSQ